MAAAEATLLAMPPLHLPSAGTKHPLLPQLASSRCHQHPARHIPCITSFRAAILV